MFRDKWFRMVIPPAIVVVTTLSVFFICWLGGRNDAIYFAIAAAAIFAIPYAVASVAFDFSAAGVVATLAVTDILIVRDFSAAVTFAVVAFTIVVIAITANLVIVNCSCIAKKRLMFSFLAEVSTIGLPIYFTLN